MARRRERRGHRKTEGARVGIFCIGLLATGLLIAACSGGDCPDCLDPNVVDYRLSLVGEFCATSTGASVAGMLAVNLNSVPNALEALVDSDGDGLSDREEAQLGSIPTSGDSDGDGFSDLAEMRAQSTPITSGSVGLLDPDNPLVGGCEATSDTDRDLLRDCEEAHLGLNSALPDSDGDGILDAVELRFGANPAVADTEEDLDGDGVTNGFEILAGTNPRIVDRNRAAQDALTFSLVITRPDDPIRCIAFEVSNIELKVTTPDGSNRILLHRRMKTVQGLVEHRFACALTRFPGHLTRTEPKNGRLRIPEAGWFDTPFTAMAHCVCPNGDLDGC
ncbi:MAG: hypothetical protein IPK13_25645 [Deltaproteobacteria bacterium]|nr:hypothetical protein [Deltaproteobacteria bacterium]